LSAIECLAFASKARVGLRELTTLVRWSRERNEQLGVTGLLLYDSDYFFGYLEGEAQRVQRLYDAIALDTRHHEVRLLQHGALAKCRFDRWLMGYLYEPIFVGELEALWSGKMALGDIDARLKRWSLEGDVL